MATLLDIGILEVFNPIFAVLFVFVLLYGILSKVNLFGEDKQGLNALISLAVAFMVLVTGEVTSFITTIAPWFVMVAVVGFLVLLGFMIFGVKAESLEGLASDKLIQGAILTISIIIVLIGISAVYGQDIKEGGETTVIDDHGNEVIVKENPELKKGVTTTIFNPKVLGVLLILLTCALAVKLLAGQAP